MLQKFLKNFKEIFDKLILNEICRKLEIILNYFLLILEVTLTLFVSYLGYTDRILLFPNSKSDFPTQISVSAF